MVNRFDLRFEMLIAIDKTCEEWMKIALRVGNNFFFFWNNNRLNTLNFFQEKFCRSLAILIKNRLWIIPNVDIHLCAD